MTGVRLGAHDLRILRALRDAPGGGFCTLAELRDAGCSGPMRGLRADVARLEAAGLVLHTRWIFDSWALTEIGFAATVADRSPVIEARLAGRRARVAA